MPAVDFSGVTIAWADGGAPRDPLGEMLEGVPARSDAGGDAESTRSARFELRAATAQTKAHPQSEGWEPSFFHGAVYTFRGERGFLVWDTISRVLVPADGSVIEAEIAPEDEETTPGSTATAIQVALILALRRWSLFHLHAAALLLPDRVPVIVVGGSGAGKTTTTLALLEGTPGAEVLCDDSIYIAPGDEAGSMRLVALPRELHVGPATLAMFPRLEGLAGPRRSHTDKRSVGTRAAYPGRVRQEIALRVGDGAVALFPTVTREPTTEVASLARAEAFGRMLGSSGALVVEGAPGREENLEALRGLLGAVRCYEVKLGRDAMGIRGGRWWRGWLRNGRGAPRRADRGLVR